MRIRLSYFFFIVSALPILFLLQKANIAAPVHQISLTVSKPFLIAGDSVSYTFSVAKESLAYLLKSLKDQRYNQHKIQELQSRLLHYQEVLKENARLKELIQFSKSLSFQSVGARVIGWDLTLIRKSILLDKGSKDKIQKDMAVVVPLGLVGRVIEVHPTTARALLLIDPDSRVSAMASDSRAQGVLAGDGSPRLLLKYLELDSGVSEGEVVISSGIGGVYPKGIAIGKIQKIYKDSDGLHLIAEVLSFVHFTKLEEVLCLAISRED